MPDPTDRACRACGSTFVSNQPHKVYCSKRCRDRLKWRRRRSNRPEWERERERRRRQRGRRYIHRCVTCDAEFVAVGTGNKYCSDECRPWRGKASCPVPWAECLWCGHWFVKRTSRKYCSERCQRIMDPRRAKVTVIAYGDCRQCGRVFVRRVGHLGGFCSERCSRRATKNYRRHLSRASAGGELFTLREIAERDGWRCHLCRRKVPDREYRARPLDPTIDHLVPANRRDGGTHTRDNVALAHNRCNGKRNTGGEVQLRLTG